MRWIVGSSAVLLGAPAWAQERWDHPMMGAGMGWLAALLAVAVVAALVLVLLALAKRISGDRRPEPLDLLKERLARGEIGIEEYEARRRILER